MCGWQASPQKQQGGRIGGGSSLQWPGSREGRGVDMEIHEGGGGWQWEEDPPLRTSSHLPTANQREWPSSNQIPNTGGFGAISDLNRNSEIRDANLLHYNIPLHHVVDFKYAQ